MAHLSLAIKADESLLAAISLKALFQRAIAYSLYFDPRVEFRRYFACPRTYLRIGVLRKFRQLRFSLFQNVRK
jgi:hypothetical protein